MATLRETRSVAWWLFWRYSLAAGLAGLAAGMIAGAIIGIIVTFAGGTKETIKQVAPYFGFAAGTFVSFFVLNFFVSKMIGKKIGNKTIQLIED